jgi:homoserine O-succinyltransferase/O-acetyltransferase
MESYLPVRVAILDLNNRTANESMRCLRAFLASANDAADGYSISVDEFDVRGSNEIPDLSYDIYLASGGPGSPFDGEDHEWENRYFEWAQAVYEHNVSTGSYDKHVLFICHSFQLMCRCFDIATVSRRKSTSFGITPIHMTDEGRGDLLYQGLTDPFYAADFRDWQVTQPNIDKIQAMGGSILSVEKDRPNVPLERATTGIRLNKAMVGVQFHPEADVDGMLMHFGQEHRKQHVVEHHGQAKYDETIARMRHPDFLDRTHRTVLPNFLRDAILSLKAEHIA